MNFKKAKKTPLCLRDELPLRFEEIKNGKFTPKDREYIVHEYLQGNDITVKEDGSKIVPFIKGKHILVTGATGFLGKLLVEKLLRSCEDITVYVIIREKKGKDMTARLNEILENYAFHKLAKIRPNFKRNLIGISADLSKPGMSMSEEDRNLLTSKINIIYHSAAAVRFDEPLKIAINCNIMGLVQMVELAKACQNFEVLTHISTAFSNCNRYAISEEIYKPTVSVEQLLTLNDNFSEEVLNRITPGVLGDMPNVYTLTKQAIEDYLKSQATIIPICICRPSIVLTTAKEPFGGYGENLLGPIGFILAVGLGLVHTQKLNMHLITDVVPADFVVNHCIAASFQTAREKNLKTVSVYNCTSSCQNPITWRQIADITKEYAKILGSMKALSDPFFLATTNEFLYMLGRFFFHNVPAAIADFGLVCVGKKPMMKKAYEKIDKFSSVLEFFTTNEFKFDNTNTVALWNSLNDVDQENFNFNFVTFSWNSYWAIFCAAAREVIVQDSLEDTYDQSQQYVKKLSYIRKTYLALVVVICGALIFLFLRLLGYILKF